MLKIKTDSLLTPLGLFILYILSSALVIMGFRFIIPGEAAPLSYFSVKWRLIRGVLEYLNLFPSLVFTALVIPFAVKITAKEKINPYSKQFLQTLTMPIIASIAGAAINGLLFSLALPLAMNYEANIHFQGRLYKLAREQAQEQAAAGEWDDAAQFISICERIWPNGKDASKLKTEIDIRTEGKRLAQRQLIEDKPETSLPGPQPVNATEALDMAETALSEERYFDAHWLATLGGNLAGSGSAEKSRAVRLTGLAWNGINSLAPNSEESRAFAVYRLKKDGYEALLGGEWIRAYYIFLDLIQQSPGDPDVAKYLAMAESGVKTVAFFIDELELTMGRMLSGAIFSLPMDSGRMVMRISSLSAFPDTAYGIGNEIMAFDNEGRPKWSMEAPYSKIMPLALNTGPGVAVLLRAIDRENKAVQWEPLIRGHVEEAPAGAAGTVLAIPWDDFTLLTKVSRGLSFLSLSDLREASLTLGNSGYQSEIFEAELLRRFEEPLLLLPLGIFAVVIGWRYRALKHPRYMVIPMLFILPLVFNGIEQFCRSWVNKLGIFAVVSLGFTSAAIFFAIGIMVLFIFSLIILASQHG